MRRSAAALCAAILFGALAAAAWASESHRISQQGRAFDKKEITIDAGDVVDFTNDDEFIHQIYVQSPAMSFDSAESYPGNTIELKFPTRGTFEVHCHIHPKMRLVVNVR
ncbi:MAG: cupredoxin domain-containing protein [Methylocella sp.]